MSADLAMTRTAILTWKAVDSPAMRNQASAAFRTSLFDDCLFPTSSLLNLLVSRLSLLAELLRAPSRGSGRGKLEEQGTFS